VDVAALQAEDVQRAREGLPRRFAYPFEVQISPATHGVWETLPDGSRLWRLRILSTDALTLNLGFSRFHMPPGGRLFIYSSDYQHLLGPFTAVDHDEHGQLWTPVVPGEQIVLEVQLPDGLALEQLDLQLTSVNHDYVGFNNPAALLSGSCNLDVVCSAADGYPMVDPWRDEIRSAAVYSVFGFMACSGALINNTAQNSKPYFLTAKHCGVSNSLAPSVVVYWNYENSYCRTVGVNLPGDGVKTQYNSGAIWRAAYDPSDFTLLELDDPIDPAVNPYFAGWDRADSATTSAVGIHHPNTDEKRISFENNPTAVTSFYGTTSPGDGTHLRVVDWDLGVTEPGSSGSPLFSPAGRIIGQLHGGDSACGNNLSDWYGRLHTSWTGGGSNTTRLSNWLDPLGSGVTTLDGKNLINFDVVAEPETLAVCAPTSAIYSISVTGSSAVVSLSASGQPAGTSTLFSPASGNAPFSSELAISNTALAAPGSYPITIAGLSGAVTQTDQVTLNLYNAAPGAFSLLSPGQGATEVGVSPQFLWSSASQAGEYLLEVAEDASFSNLVVSATVTATSHTFAAPLAYDTEYFWRVTPKNTCGWGAASAVFSFTTAPLYQVCRAPNLAIPDNSPAGVSDSLSIASSELLADLDVTIQADHTWIGDLVVSLQHQESGTTVTLIDRPGYPALSHGCGYDNIDATLDDSAASPVETQCRATPPAIFGVFTPNNPLSAFNMKPLGGTWRLTISDHYLGDTGTLLQWCLTWKAVRATIYLPLVRR
jgi:subtilisin-like proprotein convertase family protein